MPGTKALPSEAEVREKEVLTPEDVAVLIGCKRTKDYELISTGAIPSYRVGRLRRVRRMHVEKFIVEQVAAN